MKRDIAFYFANIYPEIKRIQSYQKQWREQDAYTILQRMLDIFLKLQTSDQIPSYRKKEIIRLKEAVLQYLFGDNLFQIDDRWIDKYFAPFIESFLRQRNVV